MAQEYYPFEAGPGDGVTETQWRRMFRLAAHTGVVDGLTATAGIAGLVSVAAGSCIVDGHFYRTDAAVSVPFVANPTGSPQTVSIIARLDPTANTITLATTKVALVQQESGIYEMLLATFMVPPSGSAQVAYSIADRRWPIGQAASLPQVASGFWGSASELTTHGPLIIPARPFGVGVPYRITAWGAIASTVPAGATFFWPIRIDGNNVGPLTTYIDVARVTESKDVNDNLSHTVTAVYQGSTATNTIAPTGSLFVRLDRLI